MKRLLVLVLAIGLMLCFGQSGCGGGGGGSSDDEGDGYNTVTITGNLVNGSHAKNLWFDRLLAKINTPAYALDPNEVAKVMVFYKDGSYISSEVTDDGNFSIQVNKGDPAGMIFVGAGDSFLGYLTLGNGIDTLPLNSVAEDVAEIDLGILDSSGLILEPSQNPLGNEIPLTPAEQKALAQCDDLFSSIVKNPDVDGNGIIDFLEGKRFFIEIHYGIPGGRFGSNLTPEIYQPIRLEAYQIHVFRSISPDSINCPETVYLTGPQLSPFSDPTALEKVDIGSYCTHRIHVIDYPDPLVGGQYMVEYPDVTSTFNIPDQSSITSNAVLVVPTVTLNDDGTIHKINWTYQLAYGSEEIVNPESIITQIKISLADWDFSPQGLYDSDYFSPVKTELDLSSLAISWADVGCVGAVYFDIYDNSYFIRWDM